MTRLNLEFVFGWLAAATPSGPAPTLAELPALKTGDIVFQMSSGGQSAAIIAASRSAYTHMGLVDIGADGKPMVVEASGPVRVTPLDQWIRHGVNNRIAVKRIKGLTEADAGSAIARARAYLGRPYDPFFYSSTDAIYCSELVHLAFQEGPKLTVGAQEKVSAIGADMPAVRQLIKERWRKHPACQTKDTRTFEACYKVILEETLVTPASIARDPKVELVFTNFGPGAE
jgi:hypothetical protein